MTTNSPRDTKPTGSQITAQLSDEQIVFADSLGHLLAQQWGNEDSDSRPTQDDDSVSVDRAIPTTRHAFDRRRPL